MSTELKPVQPVVEVDKRVSLTQYAGPKRCGDRRRLQLTQGPQYLNVSKEQALDLARALLDWVADERPADYE